MSSERRERREPAETALDAARPREVALVLPLIGVALFSPPLIALFALDAQIFGAPFILVYVFVVWAALIIAARLQARRLTGGDASDDPP